MARSAHRPFLSPLVACLVGVGRADVAKAVFPVIAASVLAAPVLAAEGNLAMELNRVQDRDGKCVATLVMHNQLGHTLDRFNVDLYVFDRDGVVAQRVMIDLAPLPNDKTTVAAFPLSDGPCDGIGKVLVNNVPSCRSETGETVDCISRIAASSRNRIDLIK